MSTTYDTMTADTTVARQQLRGAHTADLDHLAAGKNSLGEPILLSEVFADEARRQRDLRQTGAQLVWGALAALGHRFSGTDGWHITAYVTPEGALGVVNIADGVAVKSNIVLGADLAEALTVPLQGEGCQASGAAAWTSPDVGLTTARPSTPPGWRQLLVDVRARGDIQPLPLMPRFRLVCFGLRTCYGDAGSPSRTLVREISYPYLDTSWWPFGAAAGERVVEMRDAWVTTETGLQAALDPEIQAALASGRVSQYPDQDTRTLGGFHTSERDAQNWLLAEAARAAAAHILKDGGAWAVYLTGSTHRQVEEIIGLRTIDNLRGALVRVIFTRLAPVLQSVRWMMLDMNNMVADIGDYGPHMDQVTSLLAAAALSIGEAVTKGIAERARAQIAEFTVMLYASGPVYFDQIIATEAK